jgi:hypothetical protein
MACVICASGVPKQYRVCPACGQARHERSVAIWVGYKYISVGIYYHPNTTMRRISGTRFTSWASVFGVLARLTSEGYNYCVDIRHDVRCPECDGEMEADAKCEMEVPHLKAFMIRDQPLPRRREVHPALLCSACEHCEVIQ